MIARLAHRDGHRRVDVVVLGMVLASVLAALAIGYESAEKPDAASIVIALGFAGVLAAVVWQRPEWGLLGLAALMPFYPTIFGRLFVWGVPVAALAPLRFWKEVVVITLGVKVLSSGLPGRSTVDRVVLGFLLLTALYVVLPLGPSIYSRLLGARELASYLLVFLAARHLPLGQRFAPRLLAVLLAAGALMAALAFWDHFDHAGWSSWIASSGLEDYQQTVLNSVRIPGAEIGHLGDQQFIRAGALFLNPLSLAIYLLIPVGLVMGRLVGGHARRWEILSGILCAGGVLMTLTRSAITVMPLMVLVALVLGRRSSRRVGGMVVAAGILWPLASAVALGSHLSDAIDPNAVSTQGHLGQLATDTRLLIAHPLGRGLATGGGIAAQRLGDAASTTAENWYFQVGLEIGVVGLALFLVLLWMCLAELRRRSQRGAPLALEALCATAGLAAVGLVMHIFGDQVISYSLWTLVGVAMAAPVATIVTEARLDTTAHDSVPAPPGRSASRARVPGQEARTRSSTGT